MRVIPERLDTAQSLLDHQVVDADGRAICKVDDIELEERGAELRLSTILTGPGALGPRVAEPFGRWMTAVWSRLSRTGQPGRIPMSAVTEVSSAVHIGEVPRDDNINGFEQWTRDNVISKLPGASHEDA
jgi:sporulation protein YlmC with PRC-barrel domain